MQGCRGAGHLCDHPVMWAQLVSSMGEPQGLSMGARSHCLWMGDWVPRDGAQDDSRKRPTGCFQHIREKLKCLRRRSKCPARPRSRAPHPGTFV